MHKNFSRITSGEETTWRKWHTWKDNIKIGVTEIVCVYVD